MAQDALGTLYAKGRGVPQDFVEAAVWYRKAAEQGDEYAQYTLGRLYKKGRGVPQDFAEAATWYRKSAEQGNAQAQYVLGGLYKNGEGVSQDYQSAYIWLSLSVKNRCYMKGFGKLLNVVAQKLSAVQLESAESTIAEYLELYGTVRSAAV